MFILDTMDEFSFALALRDCGNHFFFHHSFKCSYASSEMTLLTKRKHFRGYKKIKQRMMVLDCDGVPVVNDGEFAFNEFAQVGIRDRTQEGDVYRLLTTWDELLDPAVVHVIMRLKQDRTCCVPAWLGL